MMKRITNLLTLWQRKPRTLRVSVDAVSGWG